MGLQTPRIQVLLNADLSAIVTAKLESASTEMADLIAQFGQGKVNTVKRAVNLAKLTSATKADNNVDLF